MLALLFVYVIFLKQLYLDYIVISNKDHKKEKKNASKEIPISLGVLLLFVMFIFRLFLKGHGFKCLFNPNIPRD